MKIGTKTALTGLAAMGGIAAYACVTKALKESNRTPDELAVSIYNENGSYSRTMFKVDGKEHSLNIAEAGADFEQIFFKMSPHRCPTKHVCKGVMIETRFGKDDNINCHIMSDKTPYTLNIEDRCFIVFHSAGNNEADNSFSDYIPERFKNLWSRIRANKDASISDIFNDTIIGDNIRNVKQKINKCANRRRPF